MKKEFISRQQIELLPERIRKAQETNATEDLQNAIWKIIQEKIFKQMNILVVGSGGSYPAAILAKDSLIHKLNESWVEAVTPQTAIRMITRFDWTYWKHLCEDMYDLIIGISYSGKTNEIKSISKTCFKKKIPFILLTGADPLTLFEEYSDKNPDIKIISYFNSEDISGKEKGLISMFSTLAPAIIFDDEIGRKRIEEVQEALTEGKKFVEQLNVAELAKALKKSSIIHVFYEWNTLATAMDIESKFTESGIANVILHEKKNFAHGRCTSLYNQDFSIIINLSIYDSLNKENGNKIYKNEYDEMLSNYLINLCEEKKAHYIEMGTVKTRPETL